MTDSENRYGEDFVPGTTKIFVSPDNSSIETSNTSRPLKKNKKGIILLPQPCDSPNDPLNWSSLRKGWHFVFLCFITALTAAISNDAGAAQDSLNAIYGISYDAMNTGAGVLFLFIGWSCIVFAPASSLYGRRITYIICVLSGCLGSIWFAVSRRTSDTIWSQAFVGLSEACAEAQVQQSLSDIFFQHQLGSALTLYILATSVGSFLGPLIAHIISEAQSFRWVGWWGAIICAATLILVIFTCEETVFDRSKYSVVYDGSQAFNENNEIQEEKKEEDKDKSEPEVVKTTESYQYPQDAEIQNTSESEKPSSYWKQMAIITPASYLEGFGFKQYIRRFFLYFKVFRLPAVWLSGILWGLQDAYMTFFLTTQDTYFSEAPWNYSEKGVAIMNVATLIGAVIGCFVSGILSDKHVLWMAKRNSGILEPEYRLWLLFITLIISPLGLIMFGVGAARQWPWQAIYVGLGFIGFGWGSIGDTAMSYLMDAYPEIVIQGMVCVSIINNTLACIFTFVCSLWLDSAGTESTYIVLAVIDFVSIAMIIPTLYYGKSWRRLTKNLYLSIVDLSSSS